MHAIRRAAICATFAITVLTCLSSAIAEEEFPELSPFSKVTWEGRKATVVVEDKSYDLVSIEGIELETMVQFCKSQYGEKWQKRIEEDLVMVLTKMGQRPGETVKLELVSKETGEKVTLPDAKMTKDNRQKLWAARMEAEDRFDKSLPKRITADEAKEDIDMLLKSIESDYSYVSLRRYDYKKALNEIKSKLEDKVSTKKFAVDLSRALAGFGDGHTRIRSKSDWLPSGYLPLVIEELDGKLIALQRDRKDFFDSKHPYLKKIDGIDAEAWVKGAGEMVAKGSPQFQRVGAITLAHWVRLTRHLLGHEDSGKIEVILSDKDGGDEKTVTLDVTDDMPTIFPPSRDTGVAKIDDRIGYVRIAEMTDDRFMLHEIAQAVWKFAKETQGLIIDVRGNPGGNRTILRTLFPIFMIGKDRAKVLNVAAFRLREGDKADATEGFLGDRELWPLSSQKWQPYQKDVIEAFAKGFKPEWQPPADKFSNWHYMVASPLPGMSSNSYKQPVVILMDEHCFSATDVFLGAFKGWRNVTLMGRPSGGGSGRAVEIRLPNSHLEVALSSMASFQPDGSLYDGNGVQPDIVVPRTLDDILGKSDSMLEKAVEHLSK